MTALTIIGICFVAIAGVSGAAVNDETVEALTKGGNKFALKLYHELSKDSGDNTIVSPLSVQLLLTLTYAGAKGTVADEIATTLGFPANLKEVLRGNKILLDQLQDPVLKIAAKMFIDKDAKIKPEFQEMATRYFQSAAETLDFQDHPEEAANEINSWVAKRTNNRITQLFSPGSITSDTSLILANAVHFKSDWKYKFNAGSTEKKPFYTSTNNKVDVDMMFLKARFRYLYHDQLKAKMLEMPYKGEEFRMLFILPDDVEGLAEMEKKLLDMDLADEMTNLDYSTVVVTIPKFTMEKTMQLNDVISGLGMSKLFFNPDLSGISDSNLEVSQLVQKAFIKVNEEGTEAAAATGSVGHFVMPGLDPPMPEVFTADHPFIYVLTHNSNEIIFIGSMKKQ